MKNTNFKFLLLILIFSSMSLRGMSCAINNINANVSTILDILEHLNTSGIDVNVTGLDQLAAEISLVEQVLLLQLAIIESQLDVLNASSTEVLCMLISMPTTISMPGTYCLSQDIAGTITINSSNVTLDLNGHQVTMGITITAGNDTVSIANGTVLGGSPGILVQAGCTNISITSVLVKNGTSGILFEQVNGALVKHCTLTNNMIGLMLVNSNRINVFDTIATANTYAGFDLVSSCTNSFIECKALSTGQNNSVIYNNEVVGFSSSNGYGNIFERCIANGTQALSTTDSNSLVAGFALLGSESNSKIIGCESANANASNNGVTVPYGILLQGTIDLSVVLAPNTGNLFNSIDWSPDGQYVAVGIEIGGVEYGFLIYSFDRVNNTLTAIAGALNTNTDSIYSVNWSPDGRHLAVAGNLVSIGYGLQIYTFDPTNNSLTAGPGMLAPNASGQTSVDWSPNGQYVVVCAYELSPENALQIYSFDPIANTLIVGPGALNAGDSSNSVNWSPDGQYVAVCGNLASTNNGLQIYSFDQSSNTLTPGPGALSISLSNSSVAWSPDGQYVAVGASSTDAYGFQVFGFSRPGTLIPGPGKIDYGFTGDRVASIDWSPDGQYLVVVGNLQYSGYGLLIYDFDQSSNTLIVGPGTLHSSDAPLQAVNWSPDGHYVASCDQSGDFDIVQALEFPFQNLITDNTVYCNGHDVSATFTGATGVGISGTSICNMIIGNTAYNNPPTTSNFFVPSNYYFVTNVFNPLYGQAPTALQNISLNGNDPITAPVDIGLLAQQILFNVTVPLPSQLEAIEATLISAIDKISSLESPCSPTPITAGTTITAAGNYCVAQSILSNGNIVINASDVYLDLNNRTITGTITINADKSSVNISNGTINANGAANGILVNQGASNITISNVTVKNATTGIDFLSAHGATIAGCTLTQNVTGLQLNSSYNINVADTIASSNMNAGFDLISSFTNSFINCKALSTGQNNGVIYNNEVVGFSSENGYGNIFEHCIANGTQALSTTDSNSLVAGFALLGSESCSKIIGCESANANASTSGVTVPYGILLQGTLDGTFNVTGALLYPTANVISVNWSPDGQYVAVGGFGITDGYGTNNQLQIFAFDRSNNSLTPVAAALSLFGDEVLSVNWSPDGQYLAIGGGELYNEAYQFQIFTFDRSTNNLTRVAGALRPNLDYFVYVHSVNWSPDSQYVAIGGYQIIGGYEGAEYQFQIFAFNRITNVLTPVAGAVPGTIDEVDSVNWSPDGQYVAVGFSYPGDFRIYQFDESNNSLTLVYELPAAEAFISVNWSPDGQYLAMGLGLVGVDFTLFDIFEFDRIHNQLVSVAGALLSNGGNDVYSVNWSPDGQYVAIGGSGITDNSGNQFQIFAFDRSNSNLTLVAGTLLLGDYVFSVNWSPDGQYIAVGGYSITDNSGNQFQIFTGLNFPSQNVITDNTVYCNGHDVSATFTGAVGVGISGTSICNMIIGNTAYNNPPISSNFFVPSNYTFVTNVFNPLFGQAPTALQNISLNACDPIVAPVDVGLLAQQILYDVGITIPSQINALEAVILSAIDTIQTPCAPTAITTGTTITASGTYCLAQNIMDSIVINASDVSLDLNNHKVTGTINVLPSQNQVTIKNGVVDANGGENGIWVEGNNADITIANVTVKNANADMNSTGIVFYSAQNVTIENCTLTQNSIGLQLNNSYNVQVSDTVASSNVNAGFDLISSFTNSFINCKALSTGQNNTTITNNEVVGFSSENGYGNIFERCIANGTQALFTTDSESIVAGFAFLGSESCSKIINCESANANASGMGVTVPYGILLQGTLNSLSVALTGGEEINCSAWSPDGQYIAVGGDSFTIYRFDRVTNSLSTTPGLTVSIGTKSMDWSPDGQYLAAGGQIYRFDPTNNTLVAGPSYSEGINNLYSVAWSPDGQYIAVGGEGFEYNIRIYRFDPVNNELVAGPGVFFTIFTSVFSMDWSPDGQYIAVGGRYIESFPEGFGGVIYTFDSSNNNLIPGPIFLGPSSFNIVEAVAWSPDEQYLAVAGELVSIDTALQIYSFNPTTVTLTPGPGALSGGDTGFGVDWSPDGQYVAVSGALEIEGIGVQIYDFYRGSNELVPGPVLLSPAFLTVDWSPDGQYLSIAGDNAEASNLQLLTAVQFPSQNVITDNTVYCNGHDVSNPFTGAVGVGISGTSICNMITRNTAYNNPPTTSNFFVPSNYYFVTNVFNPLYGQAPTALQNISLNACDPISAPVDVGLLAQQILYNVEVSIPSQLDVILAAVESGAPCAPTAITMGTTIAAAGNYCVPQSITSNGNIVINTNDVFLDLNNRTVTGTITIAANMSGITIRNGTINANGAASGILVNSGASNVTISNVTVKNATMGINFMSAYDAAIQGCTLTQNVTGLQLNSTYNVQVSDTVASSNVNAGFDVISSFTNSFINCKALSTGQNNTVIYNNEVVGFSSENGYGNIFEHCIANGTQALSTTDSNSLIAGFALRGSESCSKIIGCESANANASTSGVTVPYGILLQGTLDGLLGITGALDPNYPPNNDYVRSVNWSPDGQYVAVGGVLYSANNGAGYGLQIYSFNRVTNTLIAGPGAFNPNYSPHNDVVYSVNWSPDGQYVVVGGELYSANNGAGYGLQIYNFNRVTNTLVAGPGTLNPNYSPNGDSISSVNWSPDGQYVAVGGQLYSLADSLQIYSFNRVTNTLIAGPGALDPNHSPSGDSVGSVNWSPDGLYLAVGGQLYSANGGAGYALQIYAFNSTLAAGPGAFNPNLPSDDYVSSVSWSPDGQYLVVGGGLYSVGYGLQIYSFNRLGNTSLGAGPGGLSPYDGVLSVNWSPDGHYVAIGGVLYAEEYCLQIYSFDESSNRLLPGLGTFNPNYLPNGDAVLSVNWSPDGQYVIAGGQLYSVNSPFGFGFEILTALQFPSQNVITDNIVYCNGHDVSNPFTGATGVGISGTSICNMIIGNTVYNNPPTSSNFFVPSNYQFVTNIFNQTFGQGPTGLQNISLNACDPIVAPLDVALISLQNQYLMQSIIAILATKT